MRKTLVRALLAGAGALLSVCVGGPAFAQSTIRQPNAHPDYVAELEPHLTFGIFEPPGRPTGTGIGAGVRLTIPVVRNGFIPTINNSVGISFGIDWVHYDGGDGLTLGYCAERVPGPGNTTVCTAVTGPLGGPSNYLYLPGAMQWNFWLSDKFSVFGEPGLAFYYEKARFESSGTVGAVPLVAVGGRWHFLRLATLTLRLGYPTMSLGVSMIF
jgi:hypothetical protein